jgi:hypothetical protein
VPTVSLTWPEWRAAIAVRRGKVLPSMLDHANLIEEQLEMHGPSVATVTLVLSDDVSHRSYTWARWRLGIPRPSD